MQRSANSGPITVLGSNSPLNFLQPSLQPEDISLTKLQGERCVVFQVSTAGTLHTGAPLLINGQTNECRLDDCRGDAMFPPAFYKITENTVHFDGGEEPREMVRETWDNRRAQDNPKGS